MKTSLSLSVLFISFITIVHCDTVDVAYRCGDCDTGSCSELTMEVDVCTQFINPCTNGDEGYYKILEQDGTYYLFIDATDCLEGFGIELVCDYCNVDTTICNNFFLNCESNSPSSSSSVWWWLIPFLLVICFGCCIAASILGFVFYKKKKQKNAHTYSNVESVSYQSTGCHA